MISPIPSGRSIGAFANVRSKTGDVPADDATGVSVPHFGQATARSEIRFPQCVQKAIPSDLAQRRPGGELLRLERAGIAQGADLVRGIAHVRAVGVVADGKTPPGRAP